MEKPGTANRYKFKKQSIKESNSKMKKMKKKITLREAYAYACTANNLRATEKGFDRFKKVISEGYGLGEYGSNAIPDTWTVTADGSSFNVEAGSKEGAINQAKKELKNKGKDPSKIKSWTARQAVNTSWED